VTTGPCNPVLALDNLSSLGEARFKWSDSKSEFYRDTRADVMAASTAPDTSSLRHVRQAMHDMDSVLEQIEAETQQDPPVSFPGSSIGRQLRDVVRLMLAPALGSRVYYVARGGFDTHAGERSSQAGSLSDINAALTAFVTSLKTIGEWENTVVVMTSEFGRTFENLSAGTDHGHGAGRVVFGGSIQGGQKNPAPSNTLTTASGSFYATHEVDFRWIHRDVITSMGLDGDLVFPEMPAHSPLGLFA
jgi:uncharacterized protein (DUF1501 family)